MSASFAKATLHGTDLSFTNLYAADLARIQTDEDTSFEGALMDKARALPPYTPQVLEDEPSL